MSGIGILGIGAHLPTEVRRNDWWPAEVVARWSADRAAGLARLRTSPLPTSDGAARVQRAMLELGDDPFQGARERRVMPVSATSYDLEEAAARDALARAEVAASEIDLVLTHTAVPEYQVQSSACILHHRLGLPDRCFTLQVEATAFSFLAQLTLAEQMIAGGRARRALLVQSSGATRLLDPAHPYAPLFGDGATAVVVGAVDRDRGILAAAHRTDSRFPLALAAAVPAGRWYDEGRPTLHSPDLAGAHPMFLAIPDQARDAIGAVLADAGRAAAEVGFFAAHQGTPWVRQIVQGYVGLGAARSLDTFPFAASLFAANVPLVLRYGEDASAIGPDDLVVLFGGGTGVTFGASLVRWGR